MIIYSPRKYFGWVVLTSLQGSVVAAATPWALFGAVLAGLIKHEQLPGAYILNFKTREESMFDHPFSMQMFINVLGFVIVFRASQAYNRFWEGRTNLQKMASKWGDAVAQLVAFDEGSKQVPDYEEWKAHIVHLVSLLHAVSIQRLRLDQSVANLIDFSLTQFEGYDDDMEQTGCCGGTAVSGADVDFTDETRQALLQRAAEAAHDIEEVEVEVTQRRRRFASSTTGGVKPLRVSESSPALSSGNFKLDTTSSPVGPSTPPSGSPTKKTSSDPMARTSSLPVGDSPTTQQRRRARRISAEELFEGPLSPSTPHSSQKISGRRLSDVRRETIMASEHPLGVIGGVTEREASALLCNAAQHDRVYVVMQWVMRAVVERRLANALRGAEAPVLSRTYQVLSDGMMYYMECKKIVDTPFPFPYAQFVMGMMLIFSVASPVMIAELVNNPWVASIVAFFTNGAFFMLNEVARELEEPFSVRDNGLPLTELHREFNYKLESLVEAECYNSDWALQRARPVYRPANEEEHEMDEKMRLG